MRAGIILSVLMWVVILSCFSGCSAKIEFGYHGKTGVDNEQVTPEFRTPTAKQRY